MKFKMADLRPGFKHPDSMITVIKFDHKDDRARKHYRCLCDCGNETLRQGSEIISGAKSCGCLQKSKKGLSNTPEGRTLNRAMQRCYNINEKSYEDYGGRGITVSQRYKGTDGVENFIQDVGTKPGPGFSIDRIDNDGNYCPGNLQWSTDKQQADHKRNTRLITYKGETLNIAQWSERVGIHRSITRTRLESGWSVADALETPVTPRSRMITYNGETLSLTSWAERLGTCCETLCSRLSRGWSIEKTVTTPAKQHNRKK